MITIYLNIEEAAKLIDACVGWCLRYKSLGYYEYQKSVSAYIIVEVAFRLQKKKFKPDKHKKVELHKVELDTVYFCTGLLANEYHIHKANYNHEQNDLQKHLLG